MHVVLQSPSHLTSQVGEPVHVIVLLVPICSLQLEVVSHCAVDPPPSLKSHVELPMQTSVLPKPPVPLQSEVSLQMTCSVSAESPWHFASVLQTSEHAVSPHSALQSSPAVQVHAVSTQSQPVPLQLGPSPLSPHAVKIARQARSRIT